MKTITTIMALVTTCLTTLPCRAQDTPPAGAPSPSGATAPAPAVAGLPDLSQGAASFDGAVPPELVVRRAPTGHLLVRPVVNGIDAGWFIFDTGAGICVVSTAHVERLGLSTAGGIAAVGVGGGENAALYRAERIDLGPLTLRDHPAITTDLSFLGPHLGEEIAGVLGYGVLSVCIAEIDLTAPRVALYEPGTYTLAAGSWAPMSLEQRVPTVAGSFEGTPGRFQLDTGANSTVTFHEPAVRKWKLLEGRELTDSRLGGVGGFVAAKRGRLAAFELCGVRREDLTVEFAVEAKGTFADATQDGNVGAGFLAPFLIVLDYPGKRLSLRAREG